MRAFPAFQPILIVAALALAACHHGGEAQRTPHRPPALQTTDPGVAVLAAVQNARAAIAAGDRLAAFNNVSVALSNAVQLSGSESVLFPPEAAPPGYHSPAGAGGGYGGRGGGRGGGGHRGGGRRLAAGGGPPPGPAPREAPAAASPAPTNATAAPASPPNAAPHHRGHRGSPVGAVAGAGQAEVTSFDAQVRLISIQAQLQTGDLAAADAGLGAIEASASRHPAPPDLPLVRADQSLALASAAADAGRLGELQSQLEAARASLQAYQGRAHAADAKALAGAIGQALDNPAGLNVLAPVQLSLWSGRLSSWV